MNHLSELDFIIRLCAANLAISVSLTSATISSAPLFAALLTFNPAIGFTSVIFEQIESITSAFATSSKDASNLLLPMTCFMALIAFT